MLWAVLVVLCLFAIAFAAWPLFRQSRRLTPLVATVIVFTVAVSVGLYDRVGSPGVPSGRSGTNGDLPGMQEAVVSLQGRLAENPEDINGWKLLGRTQMTLGDYAGAATSYETAMDLEDARVAQTMVDLAIAILNRDQAPIQGRTASLIDSALALEPQNPSALFYAGIAAAERGDVETAASRWEILLGLNPPENIRGILEQRIAEWRGEQAPLPPDHPPMGGMGTVAGGAELPDDAVISANVSLSDEALAAMTGDAPVFIIARDPVVPTPPIAVTRSTVSQLPAVISLSDAQSMVAGRDLSAFAEIELVARVSLSGGPAARSGDWFGSLLVRPAENRSVSLTINQQVP